LAQPSKSGPRLSDYDVVIVNSSGGKDSMCAMREVWRLADRQQSDIPIYVCYQELGREAWPGSKELVKEHAAFYGWPFRTSRYRNKAGEELSLLDYVRKRGKWPSSTTRFCTSEFKRDPGGRLVRLIVRDLFHVEHSVERPTRVLQVFGYRAEESPERAKKVVLSVNRRLAAPKRIVHDWLPIHRWSVVKVWDDIRESGLRWHEAYDLGMPRLSCRFCILAGKGALMLTGRHNRELLDEYVAVEQEIGHTFQNGRSIESIRDAIDAGEEVPVERWKG
jgi:3'-phosphoadenosine 5'-phosphosulfate sulfotransferase (PAPS reductase)/FAD synthetase